MKILVVGSGGREHCLVWKLSQSELVKKIYCAPGNGGTVGLAQNVDIVAADIDKLVNFSVEEKIDLVVVGPEVPLVLGLADRLQEKNILVFGPVKDLAQLEGSKVFAKRVMQRYAIPTAEFEVFSDSTAAKEYLKKTSMPVVIKADGLAAGKGVIVCNSLNEAFGAVDLILEEKEFGRAGNSIVIEKFLKGQEVSLLLLTDGVEILPLLPAQDHKRIFDADSGPNTGGMGAYAPAPLMDDKLLKIVMDMIAQPLIKGLAQEDKLYKGILYLGLMIVDQKPFVLEFNVRFGDPETQAVLPLLNSDLAQLMLKTAQGQLSGSQLDWSGQYCLCTVLAAQGYPGSYTKGKEINGLEQIKDLKDIVVFHAGTQILTEGQNSKVVTSGGRVLNICGLAKDLAQAKAAVYRTINDISFEGMQFRTDIGDKAINK